ncbi:MAG TPA: Uma2 family endonuclease [Pseudonocardia sp.]|uniref:Uma2 family endonuclease n=1 Tax=Pseudonocardia sp. TaxID=60912 RepID=UPI002F3E3FCA
MAADPTVAPEWRFTVEEYERMGEVGILDPQARVELLEGKIVYMSPIGARHAGVVNRLNRLLVTRLHESAMVIVRNPLRLLPRSEPQPDVMVARYRRDCYESAHPTAEDVLLVIEVAESSLRTDRAMKLPIYANQGVVEVWLVDLVADVVHVHTDPGTNSYRAVRAVRPGEQLTPTMVPDLTLTTADILGR